MKNKNGQYNTFRYSLAASLGLALSVTIVPALQAATVTWIGGSSWWDYGSNWDLGAQPAPGDDVYLTQSDATDRVVSYYNTLYPNSTDILSSLTINATGTGTMTLNQTGYAHSLYTNNQYIGTTGTGAYEQSMGTNSVTNYLYLGYNTTGNGSYNLSGTGNLSAGYEYIGYSGSGNVIQTGGTHTVNNYLHLGYSSTGNGSYDMSGGTLSARYEYIGVSGTGVFNQSGGIHTLSNNLSLGTYSTGNGTYTLSGGTLNVGGNIVNGAGTGNLNIDGGTLNVAGGSIDIDRIVLGSTAGSSGSLTLSGTDTITANTEIIGHQGSGSFTQSGGTNNTIGLYVGNFSSGNGNYTLNDGTLSAQNEIIGYQGTGVFIQNGGTHTTGSLYLGSEPSSSGTFTLTGGSLSTTGEIIGNAGTGQFIQSGGVHTIANDLRMAMAGDGTYTLSGGTLNVGGNIADNIATSRLNIDGGTLNVGGYITVDALFLGSTTGTSGSHILSGTDSLADGYEYIGESGSGNIIQTGGRHTVNHYLYLGYSSTGNGNYDMSGGTLSVSNHEYIGVSGTGVFNQSGGTHTLNNNLSLGTYSTGNGTYTLSGGTLNVGGNIVNGAGTGRLNIDGGTLNVAGGSIDVDSLYLGSATGTSGSHTLGGTDTITVDTEIIGFLGTGNFIQTGGTHTVTNLSLGVYSNGSYDLSGGTLSVVYEYIGPNYSGHFTQSGGTHTVTNDLFIGAGTYTLSGGTLNVSGNITNRGGTSTLNIDGGTLLMSNGGAIGVDNLNITANGSYTVAAGETMMVDNLFVNDNLFAIESGASVSANGMGLENYGTMTINGVLGGNGTLTNFGHMEANGSISGDSGLLNHGSIAAGDGFTIDNTGTNSNYGNFDVAANGQLRINGASLNNRGSLRLNSGLVTGTGALNNSYGGTLSGRGTITTAFNNNGGVLLVENGTTSVTGNFSNSGIVQLADYSANLSGGVIGNSGTIEGFGHVGNDIDNTGTIEAIGGTLTLGGAVNNQSGGMMTAGSGSKLLIAGGMSNNAGRINLNGGTFDNNGQTMINSGQIAGHGVLRTGGLSNEGTATFTGGATTVNGNVTNAAGAMIEVAQDAALFTGDVVNYGTFKTTNTTVTFAGTYTENGLYYSDPSDNYFTDLLIGETGYLVGGTGDNWYVSGDFINNSLQNSLWNTDDASLFLNGSGTQNLYLAGADQGSGNSAYRDNFAWGEFSLASGVSLNIFDSNGDGNAALYVGLIALADGVDLDSLLISYISSDFNIYYNPLLAGNAYLNGQTFALNGSGLLLPSSVPVPPAIWLFGSGLLGLIAISRRRRA